MDSDLQQAKNELAAGGYTCVLVKGKTVHTSRERGVKPLLIWLGDGTDLEGFAAADKVVGKATAFLYVLLRVRAVYAPVMSEPAIAVLREHGIWIEYDMAVPAIFNRARTDFCPMERAVRDINQPAEALAAIRQRLAQL